MSFDTKKFQKEVFQAFKEQSPIFQEKDMSMLESFAKISAKIATIAIAKYHEEIAPSENKD